MVETDILIAECIEDEVYCATGRKIIRILSHELGLFMLQYVFCVVSRHLTVTISPKSLNAQDILCLITTP